MDRLTSMAVFVKSADLGSFAAAAEAMGMSPQMVAKHVVFLEDRLGAALLHPEAEPDGRGAGLL